MSSPTAESPRPESRAWISASNALVVLTGLAVLYTLWIGRAFLLPIAIAVFGALLLRPVVRLLRRLRLPEGVAAALVVIGVLAIVVIAVDGFAEPATDMLRGAPERLHEIEGRLRALRKPVEDVSRATEQVEALARGGAEAPQTVVAEDQTIGAALRAMARDFLVEGTVSVFLLYFLLASGEAFLDKLSRIVRDAERAKNLRELVHAVERQLSKYLLTVTIINVGEGTCIGLAGWAIGVPSPLLWGVIATLVNYVPYVGPIAGCAAMTLTAVSVLPFERALLVPLAYLIVSSLEGYLVTPMIVGRSMLLDPVAVFLGVLFWGWLWGIPGTLLAVPILVATKITCERFERLAPVAALIGGKG